MSYFANTVRNHLKNRIERFQAEPADGRKMIFMIPAMQESTLLAIAEAVTAVCLKDLKIKLVLKIAAALTAEWSDLGIAQARSNGWLSEGRDLTYTRSIVNTDTNCLLVIVLCGADQVTDSAGLADFHTCDPDMIWNEDLRGSFSSWTEEKLKSVGMHGYCPDDLTTIDRVIKPIFTSGTGDLLQLSDWLEKLDLSLAADVTDVPRLMLANLQAFGLPVLSRFPFNQKRKQLGPYIHKALEFFNYTLFLEAQQRDKALKAVASLQKAIFEGDDPGISFDDEEVCGPFASGQELLVGLKDFIENDGQSERDKLMRCDFIVIWDDILKFKDKAKKEKKESTKKLTGSPVEVLLSATWMTLREFYIEHKDESEIDIKSIEIFPVLFKHDIDSAEDENNIDNGIGDAAENAEYARRYLIRLIGGIDELLKKHININNTDGSEIAIFSELLSPEINCRYAKTAEPVLEFTVIISSEHKPLKRKYGWRLPEHHVYRLSIDLLRRAKLSIASLQEIYKLPVYHISYFEELLQATADEEVQRVLLHAIRDERIFNGALTNLLSGDWSKIDDPLSPKLKLLAEKYDRFVTATSSKGLFSTIFSTQPEWPDLRKAYAESFEAALALTDISQSSLIGMLTRAFLIVEQRSLNLDDTWHADLHEHSGVATILHPSVVEMLEAQIVYLTRCFNFAANKELSKTPSRESFKAHIWRTYVDLSSIQSPLTGLLSDESKNLCADVRGSELIHRIGSSSKIDASLSTRLLVRYNECTEDDSNLNDVEMFRETSESKLLLRLMQDYFDLHPHARDGLSIAVFRNKDVQPVIAAVHSYLKVLATKPSKQKSNKRYVLNEERRSPYAISVTIFTESNDESDIFNWVQQWKERWEAAETESKYELYRNCRFSVAHRIVEKNSLGAFQKLIKEQFEADIAVFYDFIGAGTGVNEFERVEPFDITCRDLKFPILEKACCTVSNPAEKYKRKRVVSNRQFALGAYHATLLHGLKSGTQQTGTVVVGSGDFSPWRALIDSLHDKAEWIICIDPNMDERLIRTPKLEKKKEREIIGFGSGVGSHGEDNYTISTEQFSFSDIHFRLKASIQQLYAAEAGWSPDDCKAVAKGILRVAPELSGLSLVRATGAADQYIRDFMAYSLARKLLRGSEDLLCESLISLDAYRHWFDLADNLRRPDLMWMQVWLQNDGCLHVKLHLIECKMGRQAPEHILKAKSQIDNGLSVLGSAFKNSTAGARGTGSIEDRPDRRYWWMQLHRLIASKTEVSKIKYSDVLSALERLAEGNFLVTWGASVFAFWIDSDPEVKRTGYWNVDGDLNVVANVYTVGGEFVRQLMTDTSRLPVDWTTINAQKAPVVEQDEEFIPEDIEDDYTPWAEDMDENEDESEFESAEEEIVEPANQSLAVVIIKESTPPSEPETVSKATSAPSETTLAEPNPKSITAVPPVVNKEAPSGRILLGETVPNGHPVYWEFDHPGLENRHMLIFGSSGQGKTYAIQGMLCEMSKFKQNSLIIDYTYGFLPNHLEHVTKEVLKPAQHVVRNDPLPINPFLPQMSDNGGIVISENSNSVAKRIAGLFNSVYSIGDQQYSVLHRAIMESVDSLGSEMNLDHMLKTIESMAEDKKFKASAQSLHSKLRPFVLDCPFSSGNVSFDWDHLFMKQDPLCNIFQLAGMDMHSARLITEFILWDLYGHLQSKGKKTDPKVIVLDEVQNLDHQEGSPLSKYLREGRKFGLSLILATQTMSNMKKDERDRMFMAEHKLFFKPADTELKAFAELAAMITRQKVDDWIRKLSTLSKGECYSIGKTLDANGDKLISRALKIRIASMEERSFNE
jgi:DNA phosphorothioation-dependent restriction protein DptH